MGLEAARGLGRAGAQGDSMRAQHKQTDAESKCATEIPNHSLETAGKNLSKGLHCKLRARRRRRRYDLGQHNHLHAGHLIGTPTRGPKGLRRGTLNSQPEQTQQPQNLPHNPRHAFHWSRPANGHTWTVLSLLLYAAKALSMLATALTPARGDVGPGKSLQQTSVPSPRMAAQFAAAAWICCTLHQTCTRKLPGLHSTRKHWTMCRFASACWLDLWVKCRASHATPAQGLTNRQITFLHCRAAATPEA